MNKYSANALLSEIMHKILELEKKLENLSRYAIISFKDMDVNDNGSLTATDIRRYLGSQSISVSEQEVFLFINQWDWDCDGKLSKKEIQVWSNCQVNGSQSSHELAEMLYNELKYLKDQEETKYRLNVYKGFNILDAFESIEKPDQFITIQSLSDFLNAFGYSYSQDLLKKLMIRITKSYSNIISYFDFADYFLCNQGYFSLGSVYPNPITNPLEMKYSIHKNYIFNTGERSEIFSREYEKFVETQEEALNIAKNQEILANIENLRRTLALRKDFNIKNIFEFFAVASDSIDIKSFEEKITKLGLNKTHEDILFFFFAYDEDYDGLLNYDDFFSIFAANHKVFKMLLNNHSKFETVLKPDTIVIISNLLNILVSDISVIGLPNMIANA
jgi:Ca2+-binding EF-hand superfamily protein